MRSHGLTPLSIKSIKPCTSRVEYPDRVPGLYLVVQPSGARSWALRYRRPGDGKSAKLTLGLAGDPGLGALTLATARLRAIEAREKIERGIDPSGPKPKRVAPAAADASTDTVEALAAQFMELHAKRKTRASTAAQTEDIFRRLVLPAWRGRTVHDIRRRDVIALAEDIAIDRPYMANRMLGVLSKWFAWMVARDVLEVSPVAGVERPHQEQARDRILDDAEVRALWLACDGEGLFGALVRMLLLTGQRRGEVAGMRWSEIDAERRLWKLPAARAKNGHAHTVPLSTRALIIIEAMPRFADCDFVFTYDGVRPISGFAQPKRQLAAKAKVAGWRIHDLRRSCASGLQKLGVPVPVIEAALNHVSGTFRGVTGTYLRHDYADEIRIALQKWADHVERLVGGKPAKVVRLRGQREQ